MFTLKIKQGVGLLSLVLVFSVVGCDNLPFFSGGSSSEPAPMESSDRAASPASLELTPNQLARVGNWTITLDEFEDRLTNLQQVAAELNTSDPEAKGFILEEMVRQELLVQDAEATGIAQKKEIVGAVDEFRRALLIREVATSLTEGVEATEEEAREYFNDNKDLFVGASEWHVREIVTFSESTAKEILIELLKGADFAEMAKARSSSKSAAVGGDLGFVIDPPFPQMANALANLDVGGVSNVFKGPQGYYIIKLEAKKGGDQKTFSEIKDDLLASLTVLKQQQVILDHLNRLEEKIVVKVNLDLLKE